MHMHGTIKNNHNYAFFLEEIQIIHSINLHFFKSYISKLCYCFSLYIYIYIYDLEFNWIYTLLFFLSNNSLVTKI